MNEWKELQIDNLPLDILTGDYEFECYCFEGDVWEKTGWYPKRMDIISVLNDVKHEYRYRYRKPEPKAPTHEEIMTKWWHTESDTWKKVDTYNVSTDNVLNGTPIYIFNGFTTGASQIEDYERYRVTKGWFTGRESANLPPEGPRE